MKSNENRKITLPLRIVAFLFISLYEIDGKSWRLILLTEKSSALYSAVRRVVQRKKCKFLIVPQLNKLFDARLDTFLLLQG